MFGRRGVACYARVTAELGVGTGVARYAPTNREKFYS